MRYSRTLKKHRRFLLVFPLLAAIMTFPAVIYVFDGGVFWLPTTNNDVWMKFWDAWRLPAIIADSRNYLFTDKLFHPEGLSLVYHNFSFPHMLAFGALQTVMPPSNAFNLVYLLIIGANGLAAYVYLVHLFRDRWLGLAGAVFFGLSPFVLSQAHHPDVNLIAGIPLALYCLDRGIVEGRRRWVGLAGGVIALTLFTGLYIYVCLVVTVGIRLLVHAKGRWARPDFWRHALLLLLIVGGFSFVRLYPLIENGAAFDEALDKKSDEQGNDLIASFVNPRHPLLPADFRDALAEDRRTMTDRAYLGYVPLLLIACGLIRGRRRRSMAPWLFLLLFFFTLRLGSQLVILGQRYEQTVLPKHFLDQWLPALFEPFWDASLFQIGVALPLALLACYGLMTLLPASSPRNRVALLSLVLALTAFEYYQTSSPRIRPAGVLDHLEWLKAEDDQEGIHLIHLPFGRHESKSYGYLQSLGGYGHAEGLASRTPPSAYDGISGNLVLGHWRRDWSVICLPASVDLYQAALDALLADGFTHVILHHYHVRSEALRFSFTGIAPAYDDSFTSVYRLSQLRDSCGKVSIPLPAEFAYIAEAALSPALELDGAMSVLSFHPAESVNADDFRSLSAAFRYWKQFAHVYLREGEIQIQRLNLTHSDLEAALTGEKLILLLYNPGQTGSDGLGELGLALAKDFQACPPVIDAANLVAVYYLRREFDCALLDSGARMQVEYENGARLENLIHRFDGEYLGIESWWTRLPKDAHGVSVQVFAGDGAKVAGGDFLIHHDSLARHRLDLSGLDPGDYELRLILYRAETGKSVPALVRGSETRFERELAFAVISLE